MVSLKDIANELNLSVSVVSRVLNPAPDANARVSATTRTRIELAARKMGYQHNRAAEFMKRNRNAAIGIFVPEIANSLIANLLFGIAEGANAEGFPISVNMGLTLESYLNFMQKNCRLASSGIITYSVRMYHHPELQSVLDHYCKDGGRLLMLNDVRENTHTTLSMDEYRGGELAAEMLLKHDCSRYFCPDMRNYSEVNQICFLRCSGFIDRVEREGGKIDFASDENLPDILKLILRHRDEKYGVFAMTDQLAVQLMQFANHAGLAAGRDYYLVGYDDCDYAGLVSPSLSTVAQPFREEGRRAVAKLIRMIYGSREMNELLSPVGIVRETA